MKSLQGWKALSRRRGAVSEWFPRSFNPSRPLGTSWIMLVLCRFGGCGVCLGGFCVLLFLGFGCFVWLALHYPRFASETWVLCHADALF